VSSTTATVNNTTAYYWMVLCQWCGFTHSGVCPRVKAISYHPDGRIARIEFHDTIFRALAEAPRAHITIAPAKERAE
jgi:hypothetical protein